MDDRPLRLLARAPDAARPALEAIARHAGALADHAGKELQFEFGKDTIAFIVGCNQFVRLHFRGDRAGKVSLPKAAGIQGEPAEEAVFKMFGWVTVAANEELQEAVATAFGAAQS